MPRLEDLEELTRLLNLGQLDEAGASEAADLLDLQPGMSVVDAVGQVQGRRQQPKQTFVPYPDVPGAIGVRQPVPQVSPVRTPPVERGGMANPPPRVRTQFNYDAEVNLAQQSGNRQRLADAQAVTAGEMTAEEYMAKWRQTKVGPDDPSLTQPPLPSAVTTPSTTKPPQPGGTVVDPTTGLYSQITPPRVIPPVTPPAGPSTSELWRQQLQATFRSLQDRLTSVPGGTPFSIDTFTPQTMLDFQTFAQQLASNMPPELSKDERGQWRRVGVDPLSGETTPGLVTASDQADIYLYETTLARAKVTADFAGKFGDLMLARAASQQAALDASAAYRQAVAAGDWSNAAAANKMRFDKEQEQVKFERVAFAVNIGTAVASNPAAARVFRQMGLLDIVAKETGVDMSKIGEPVDPAIVRNALAALGGDFFARLSKGDPQAQRQLAELAMAFGIEVDDLLRMVQGGLPGSPRPSGTQGRLTYK